MFSSLTWAIINAKTGSKVIFTPVMHSRRAIDKVLLTIKILNAFNILTLILNKNIQRPLILYLPVQNCKCEEWYHKNQSMNCMSPFIPLIELHKCLDEGYKTED